MTPDRNFSPLCFAVPRLQSASEHGLVSEEAVFNARLLSVARLLLPLSSPDLANPLKSRVTLRPGAVRWPRRHRRATRGNHNHDVLCTAGKRRYTNSFAQYVVQLCRIATIKAVARLLGLGPRQRDP